jgi:cellulose synthase (UDP-forming)
VFKDRNVYTLPAVAVCALGAGTAVAMIGAAAGLSAGLPTGSPAGAALSAAFLGAQVYLAIHVSFAALAAVAPKPFLRPLAPPPRSGPPVTDVIIALDDPDDIERAAFSLAAAARMKYPADRLRLHIAAAGAAAEASPSLAALAQSYGASWIPMSLVPTRERALQLAFDRTAGQLVLFLRPGEAPAADFLDRVNGSFGSEGMLGFVEIGHFIVDGDGARADTAAPRRLPSDAGPLARALLRGGPRPSPSAPVTTVWRRGALISAGGIARSTLDGEAMARWTAVGRGWTRRVAPVPMIATFAPATMAEAVAAQAQRRLAEIDVIAQMGFSPFSRAHAGQLFQSLTLLTGALAPFALIALLAAPALAALSGTRLWGGPTDLFASLAPLAVLATLMVSALAQSGWRHSAAALFIDTAVQFKLAKPAFALIAGATPKVAAKTVGLPVALAAVSLAGLGFGGAKLAAYPGAAVWLGPVLILCALSLALSLGALGAIREPRQKRAAPRLPADMEAELVAGGRRIPGRLADISIQGARFVADESAPIDVPVVGGLIRIVGPHGPIILPVQLSRAAPEMGRTAFGMRFTGRQLIAFANAVTLVYRTQERFHQARDLRGRAPNGVLATLKALGNGLRALIPSRRPAAA